MKVNQSIFIPGGVTWANLPAAGAAGRISFVSNAGTKGSHWFDDGTRWKPLNGSAVLATLDAASGNIANSESIVFQYQMPANLWQVGDRLRVFLGQAKSGTTDGLTTNLRIGTAGTTADTALFALTTIAAANRQGGLEFDIRLDSVTTARTMPSSRSPGGYASFSTVAWDAAATISSASANALWISVGILSGGATDTVQLAHAELTLISKAN